MQNLTAFGQEDYGNSRVLKRTQSVGLQFADAMEEAYTKRKDMEIILKISHKQKLEDKTAWRILCDYYLKTITGVTQKVLPKERESTLFIHVLYCAPSLVKAKILQKDSYIFYKLTFVGSDPKRLAWYEEFIFFRKNVVELKTKLGKLEGIEKVVAVAKWVHEKVVKTEFEVSLFNPETDLKIKSLDLYRGHCLYNKMVAAYVFCDYVAIAGYPTSGVIANFEVFWNGNPPKTNTIRISRKLYYLDVYYEDDAKIQTKQELGFGVGFGHIDKTKCEVFDRLAQGECSIDNLSCEEILQVYYYVKKKGCHIHFNEDFLNYFCWYLGIDSKIEKILFSEMLIIARKVDFNESSAAKEDIFYEASISNTSVIKGWKMNRLKIAESKNPEADYDAWSKGVDIERYLLKCSSE